MFLTVRCVNTMGVLSRKWLSVKGVLICDRIRTMAPVVLRIRAGMFTKLENVHLRPGRSSYIMNVYIITACWKYADTFGVYYTSS